MRLKFGRGAWLALVVSLVLASMACSCRGPTLEQVAGTASMVARCGGSDQEVLSDHYLFALSGDRVRCFDVNSGELKWEKTLTLADRERPWLGSLGPRAEADSGWDVLPVLACRDEWHWRDGKTEATSRDRLLLIKSGAVLWEKGPVYYGAGGLSSDGRFVLAAGRPQPFSDYRVAVVDAETGRELWQRDFPAESWAEIRDLAGRDCVYVTTITARKGDEADMCVTVLDLEGRELTSISWHRGVLLHFAGPQPVFMGVTVIGSDGTHVRLRGRQLECCSGRGKILWRRDLPPGYDSCEEQVAPAGGPVVVAFTGGAGAMFLAYDFQGNRIWSSGNLVGRRWQWGVLPESCLWWAASDPEKRKLTLSMKGLSPGELAQPVRVFDLGVEGGGMKVSPDGRYVSVRLAHDLMLFRLTPR
jgi:outer membrane protein assembly factor BamB